MAGSTRPSRVGFQELVTLFHSEVLPERQAVVLPGLAKAAAEEGFYLAGGTAVALRLGHRRSVDFDWFRTEEIGDPLAFAAGLRAKCRSLEGSVHKLSVVEDRREDGLRGVPPDAIRV
jgi:hypothetical protein